MSSGEKIDIGKYGVPIGICFFIVAFVLLAWFFLRGSETVDGGYPSPVMSHSMSCSVDNYAYPFFEYDNSKRKEMMINSVFDGDSLKTISLTYTLYYDNADDLRQSENLNHAAMNIDYSKSHLHADAMSSQYKSSNGKMRFSIFASGSEISDNTLKYYLLSDLGSLYNMNSIQEKYENMGFECMEK